LEIFSGNVDDPVIAMAVRPGRINSGTWWRTAVELVTAQGLNTVEFIAFAGYLKRKSLGKGHQENPNEQ